MYPSVLSIGPTPLLQVVILIQDVHIPCINGQKSVFFSCASKTKIPSNKPLHLICEHFNWLEFYPHSYTQTKLMLMTRSFVEPHALQQAIPNVCERSPCFLNYSKAAIYKIGGKKVKWILQWRVGYICLFVLIDLNMKRNTGRAVSFVLLVHIELNFTMLLFSIFFTLNIFVWICQQRKVWAGE